VTPARKESLAVWSTATGCVLVGLALWRIGLLLSPVAAVCFATTVVVALVQAYRALRRYGRTWPDVAGEQMQELERRRRKS
jgi:hypothetical protein